MATPESRSVSSEDTSSWSPPPPTAPGFEHLVVETPGLRTHVAAIGAGEPVVLLHGFPGQGALAGVHRQGRPAAPDDWVGTGSALTFTNLSTDATVSFRSSGAVAQTTYGEDGTMTVRLLGHNVLIMFPTDIPPGPTSTLYIGQVTFTVDADQVATIQSTSGKEIDICAALS